MNRRMPRPILFAAALLVPLGLTACGVKGPLDPPPRAGVVDAPEAAPAVGTRYSSVPQPGINVTGVQSTSLGPPVSANAVENAPAARRRSALDWLID